MFIGENDEKNKKEDRGSEKGSGSHARAGNEKGSDHSLVSAKLGEEQLIRLQRAQGGESETVKGGD